jgi:hypothetical protein
MSGRQDSNLRPPGPKPGAMTGLRYAPNLTVKNYFLLNNNFKADANVILFLIIQQDI